jgi:hypothetical protein
VCLAIALAFLVRYVCLPLLDPTLTLKGAQLAASLVEKVFTSFLVTVLIGCLIFWLEPKIARQATITVVNPKDISGLLATALEDSKEWWFRGGTGRYLRAVTLPTLAERSRNSSSGKRLHVQLLDPANRSICERYANYRRGLRSSAHEAQQWTLERVRAEICGTLLAVFIKVSEYPLLRVEVTLTPTFSSFRIDLSAKYAIITKEDQRAPGVRCDQGSYFYDAYKDDMELTAQMGRSVSIPTVPIDLSLPSVRQAFADLGLEIDDLGDEFLLTSIERAKSPANPYA